MRQECIRPKTPLSLQDGIRVVTRYVEHLQHRAASQRHRLPHTPGQAVGAREDHLRRERLQTQQEARERRRANRQPASQPLPAEVF